MNILIKKIILKNILVNILIKEMILTKIVVPAGPVAATWAAISVSFVYKGFEFHTQFDLMH